MRTIDADALKALFDEVARQQPDLRGASETLGKIIDFQPTIEPTADRLEQLKRKRVRITDELTALTARAEQAERERDAAVEHVHDAIFGTNHSCFYCTMENCDGCTNSTVKEHFKYRGLQPNKYLVKSEESGKENG